MNKVFLLFFCMVGPADGRPQMMDDTCYFFPCESREECESLYALVSSRAAREYWTSMIFWDSKRPITARLLNSLSLERLAKELGQDDSSVRSLVGRQSGSNATKVG